MHPKLKELTSFPLAELVEAALELGARGGADAATMLGIGPMSPTVIRAALELGRDAEFPVMLIASRNQVDLESLGGGYVMGWDQAAFCNAIAELAEDFNGWLYICRDHGGPWQRDREKDEKLPPDAALELGMESFRADVDAGFNMLHLDPTKDPHPDASPDKVLARTVELMDRLEEYRRTRGPGVKVGYEVGTEDIVGGHTTGSDFGDFLTNLVRALDIQDLPRPCFVVGQTGTLVKMTGNVGEFDPATASELARIAAGLGVGFKEHNCDYSPRAELEARPGLGITASNVAPEFGVAETRKLLELAERERGAAGPEASEFIPVLTAKTLESGRWIKWLKKEDQGLTAEKAAADEAALRRVTEAAGHYLFDDPAVRRERIKLFANLRALGLESDPELAVRNAVKDSIARYVEAFNLAELTPRIKRLKGIS